ncbi:unnamed protein product, partial [Protopolystoma xenopodis]
MDMISNVSSLGNNNITLHYETNANNWSDFSNACTSEELETFNRVYSNSINDGNLKISSISTSNAFRVSDSEYTDCVDELTHRSGNNFTFFDNSRRPDNYLREMDVGVNSTDSRVFLLNSIVPSTSFEAVRLNDFTACSSQSGEFREFIRASQEVNQNNVLGPVDKRRKQSLLLNSQYNAQFAPLAFYGDSCCSSGIRNSSSDAQIAGGSLNRIVMNSTDTSSLSPSDSISSCHNLHPVYIDTGL